MKKFLLTLAAVTSLSLAATAEDAATTTGAGTETDPYNVAYVISTTADESNVFVKGYVVGFVTGSNFESGAHFNVPGEEDTSYTNTNLILADAADVTEASVCIPVQLPASPASIRENLGLSNNPSIYQKEVILKGQITKYFNVRALKSVSEYTIVGEEQPEPDPAVECTTVAELKAAAGKNFTFAGSASVTYANTKYIYVKDNTGSTLLFNGSGFTGEYPNGTVITAMSGSVTTYNDAAEIEPDPATIVTKEGPAVEPTLVTNAAELTTANMYEYVKLSGVAITAFESNNATATLANESTIGLYNKFKLEDVPTETVTNYEVTGIVDAYKGTIQLDVVSLKDLGTGIVDLVSSDNEVEIFTINGMRVSQDNLAKGLYIIRTNGKTQKVLVK